MTITVFCILLFAALLHASWNAIVKAGTDKLYSAIGVSGSAALIALILLPFSPQPTAASWPYLFVSCALQVVYTVLVAKTYQVSDMSQTYPLCAGRPSAGGADQRNGARGSSLLACVVRHRGHLSFDSGDGDERPHAVTQGDLAGAAERLFYRRVYPGGRHRCATLGHCAGLHALDLLHEWFLSAELGNGGAASRSVQLPAPALEKGLLGGVGTMGSYGLALWAMTQAPLAVVAALRETSILFGALIAFVLLKEKVAGLRIAAALGIAAGAILLRLA